jgi:hypothetical protein
VEIYGPGGPSILPEWKKELIDYAPKEIAKLQQDVGTKAEVIIDSGDAHQLLNRAAEQSKGDLLVIGHFPPGGHLGANHSGYGIIRESHIPVLSVRERRQRSFRNSQWMVMESLRREVECSDMCVAYFSMPTIRFAAHRFGKEGKPERSRSPESVRRCCGSETTRRVILFVKRFATPRLVPQH